MSFKNNFAVITSYISNFFFIVRGMIRRLFNTVLEGAVQSPSESLIYPNPFTKSDTSNFGWLLSVTPCFPVAATNIRIICEPQQFYETLLHYCKNASRRITLVSLYLGTGDLENQLVKALTENQQFQDRKLIINVLLDFTRGSRNRNNSRTALQPLLQDNETNCTISLYHTPVLRGLLKKYMPNRYNELIGLQHMKLYIFDDTLIISGANLSNDYFTNRQDRYYLIEDKKLTDFYSGLVHKVQSFSLRMDKNNNLSLSPDWTCAPYEGNKQDFIEKAGDKVESYLDEYKQEQNMHSIQNCGKSPFNYLKTINSNKWLPIKLSQAIRPNRTVLLWKSNNFWRSKVCKVS